MRAGISAAQLCRLSGADEALIPQWVEEGRRRAEDACMPAPSGGIRPRGRLRAILVLAPVERARGLADDLVPAGSHPELQLGIARVVFRGRPHAGPVRAAIGAGTDQ